MKSKRQVFLSSTARDLESYRAKVMQAIGGMDGYDCVAMEKWGARAWEASEFCAAKVRECDLFVGLVGHFHGSCPPGSEKSYTEIEYDAAEPSKRLMFMAVDDFPLPANLRESQSQWDRQRAFRERVNHGEIRERFCGMEEEGLATKVVVAIGNWSGDTASRGVAALPGLMQGPIRDSVVRSQAKFETVSTQIDIIASNKSMHDLLHQLQFHCYSQLIVVLQLFQPGTSIELIRAHKATLEMILDNLRPFIARPSVGGVASNMWLKKLEDAQGDLEAAVERADKEPLQKAINKMGSVLSEQLSRINTVLITAVRGLQLGAVVEVFEDVQRQLTAAAVDGEQVASFKSGIEELRSLNDRLTRLTDAHDRWQQVENELRRVDDLLRTDRHDLYDAWPNLSEMIKPLLGEHDKLTTLADKLGAALETRDDRQVRAAFRDFRSDAGLRFNQTDRDLNSLCQELRKLNKPLNSIMDSLR
jgi:hypothetical protein